MSNYHYTFELILTIKIKTEILHYFCYWCLFWWLIFNIKLYLQYFEHESTVCPWFSLCMQYYTDYKAFIYTIPIFTVIVWQVIIFVNVFSNCNIKQWHALYVSICFYFLFPEQSCNSSFFMCKKWQVHSQWALCDNKDDCGDGSDERNCHINECLSKKVSGCSQDCQDLPVSYKVGTHQKQKIMW